LDIQNGDEGMAKTSVDIDMEKLDKVRAILGTVSIRETISAAFREVIRVAAGRHAATSRTRSPVAGVITETLAHGHRARLRHLRPHLPVEGVRL
jgi:Arc/MetJ family transcription regulator